jgi:hypothetical protein
MALPVGLIEAMDNVLLEESRARRRAEARAKARRSM